jgi:glioma pathogenesis-related protein 2
MIVNKSYIEQFSKNLLNEHNRYRLEYGNVGDLELNSHLSGRAQVHVNYLSFNELKLENSSDTNIGENHYRHYDSKINFRKTFESFSADIVTKYWYKQSMNGLLITSPCNFTQIIWKSTKKLGVGIACSSNGIIYVSAFYWPKGNIQKLFNENVFISRNDDAISKMIKNDNNENRIEIKIEKSPEFIVNNILNIINNFNLNDSQLLILFYRIKYNDNK